MFVQRQKLMPLYPYTSQFPPKKPHKTLYTVDMQLIFKTLNASLGEGLESMLEHSLTGRLNFRILSITIHHHTNHHIALYIHHSAHRIK